jgi:GLPGLI family protein
MKQFIFLIAALVFTLSAAAQMKEGKIIYEQKVDMWRRIAADNTQLRSMLPQTRTSKFELHFANNQSFYKAMEEEPDITNEDAGNRVIRMGTENEYYKNFTTQIAVDKRDLMGEIFIVEDSIHSIKWKLEDETKVILGHTCKKATSQNGKGANTIAWYAEDVTPSGGPDQFNGLPGMILGIDSNNGEVVYTALELDKKADQKLIKAPSKGTKLSKEAFAKKQQELMGNTNGPLKIFTN